MLERFWGTPRYPEPLRIAIRSQIEGERAWPFIKMKPHQEVREFRRLPEPHSPTSFWLTRFRQKTMRLFQFQWHVICYGDLKTFLAISWDIGLGFEHQVVGTFNIKTPSCWTKLGLGGASPGRAYPSTISNQSRTPTSCFSTTATGDVKATPALCGVNHGKQDHVVNIAFIPIRYYSTPPLMPPDPPGTQISGTATLTHRYRSRIALLTRYSIRKILYFTDPYLGDRAPIGGFI